MKLSSLLYPVGKERVETRATWLGAFVFEEKERLEKRMNEHERKDGVDQVMEDVVHWDLGLGAVPAKGETMWQCDALRAGQLYSRTLFGSREEADAFVRRMQQAEPDQIFAVEAIKASAVWN